MNIVREFLSLTLLMAGVHIFAETDAQIAAKEKLQALKIQAKRAHMPSTEIPQPVTGIAVSYNALGEEQAKSMSMLEMEIVKLENELAKLQETKTDRSKQKVLSEKIRALRQRKTTEDRLASYLKQLGALDTALKYNRELLEQIGDEIQKLKDFETKKPDTKTDRLFIHIKEQMLTLKTQQRKLEAVLKELESKRNSATLKVASINRK